MAAVMVNGDDCEITADDDGDGGAAGGGEYKNSFGSKRALSNVGHTHITHKI